MIFSQTSLEQSEYLRNILHLPSEQNFDIDEQISEILLINKILPEHFPSDLLVHQPMWAHISAVDASKTTKKLVLTMDSITSVTHIENTDSLANNSTIEFKYDDDGNVTYEEISTWYFIENKYDENNNLIEEKAYSWNDSLNEYIYSGKTEHIYDSDKIIQITSSNPESEIRQEEVSYLIDYEYNTNNNLNNISHRTFIDSLDTFFTHLEYQYKYDEQGILMQKTIIRYSFDSEKEPLETVIDIVYTDETKSLFDSLKFSLNQEPYTYRTFKYDQEKNLVEDSFFKLVDNEWTLYRNFNYKYNTHNLVVEMAEFELDENDWVLDYSYKYKYNEHNKVTEQIFQSSDDTYQKTKYFYDSSNEGSIIYDNSNHQLHIIRAFIFVFELIFGSYGDIFDPPEQIQQRSKLDKTISYRRNDTSSSWEQSRVEHYHYSEREIIEIEPEADDVSFSVFPNPASRFVVVNYGECEWNASVEIYNLDGNLLNTKSISLANNVIPLKGLSIGTYILKIKDSEEKMHTFKIVKN